MTVADLIEELSKHPRHHVVVLQTGGEDFEGNPLFSLIPVTEVGSESGYCQAGPVVTLSGAHY